ncbi:J domain-containing protein, partial [Desulfovibrio oxamicus]|nr:J domain-containing protein [Nitratidesulfovibrio oxamicus]
CSGRKLRLRGKGLGTGAARGDQYVRIGIRTPGEATPRERELWEELARTSAFRARD